VVINGIQTVSIPIKVYARTEMVQRLHRVSDNFRIKKRTVSDQI
jgi:hypothetical protein